MKKLFMALIILIAFSVSASAQMPTPFTLYAGGAVSMPTSDAWNQMYKTGFHGMAGVGYKIAPNFQVVGKLEYHTFKMDFGDVSSLSGGTNKLWMYGVDGRFSANLPAAPIKPYFLGGIGMANIKATEIEGLSDLAAGLYDFNEASVTKVYFNVGAGLELASGPAFGLFAQVRYVSIATDDQASTFVPVTIGLKFF